MEDSQCLETALQLRPNEVRESVGEEIIGLMQMSRNAGFDLLIPYAFECQCCKSIWEDTGLLKNNVFYQIKKLSVGPTMIKKTDASKLLCDQPIFHLNDLGFEPECDSHINHVKDVGYVCDHCYDTIFTEN